MMLGQPAGAADAQAFDKNVTPQDAPYKDELKAHLITRIQKLVSLG